MAQTTEGRIKQFCKKWGISITYYNRQVQLGLKWCIGCKRWHRRSEFSIDNSRYDGLTASYILYRNDRSRKKYEKKPRPEKGRVFVIPRDGDKKQARRRVNYLITAGILPKPNTLPCADCGHIWEPGERRHEYDHYQGYNPENHEMVEAVCSICHKKRTK